jgi:hypothetical protein
MLSTVAPCGSFVDIPGAPVALWVRAEGKLLAAPYGRELASWLAPYMIRAKLRFDMRPSRRTFCGYPYIVYFSERTGASERQRAAS